MIDHSKCEHARTSKDRAKCRRAQAGGSVKEVDFSSTPKRARGKKDDDDNYGQTPSRKEDECHKCGVEWIKWRGTDPMTGILLFVGDRCKWYIKTSPDLAEVPR